jgi:hypothetical protein
VSSIFLGFSDSFSFVFFPAPNPEGIWEMPGMLGANVSRQAPGGGQQMTNVD